MKKVYSTIVILISLITSCLLLISADKSQQESFLLLNLDQLNLTVFIKDYDRIEFNQSTRQTIDLLADKHQAKIMFTHFGYQDNGLKFLYTSNIQEDIVSILKIDKSALLPYTTIGQDANINDILSNDSFIYDQLATSTDSQFHWVGNFYISVADEDHYNDFIKDFCEHFSIPIESISNTSRLHRETGQFLNLILLFSCGILFVLWTFVVVQKINSNTSKIGVLLLNGYSKARIIKKLFSSDAKLLLISSLTGLIILLWLPHIPLSLLLLVIAKDLLLLCLLYLIYYLFIKSVLKSNSIANILKKQQIARKLSRYNLITQVVITSFILLIGLVTSQYISDTLENANRKNQYTYLLPYGVIPSINSNFLSDSDINSSDIIIDIANSTILQEKFIYVNFDKYRSYMDNAIVADGYLYEDLYAVVTANYFTLEYITLYDQHGKIVSTESISHYEDTFILPKNYNKSVEALFDAYLSNCSDFYLNGKADFNPQVLYYDNKEVNTYFMDINKIDSPAFKIVRFDERRNYSEAMDGLSLYAVGMNTALKFYIDNDSELVTNELSRILIAHGYPNTLPNVKLVTYADYLNADLSRIHNALGITLSAVFILLIISMFAQLQFIILFMMHEHRKITIKRYLGHGVLKIYKDVFISMLYSFIIACSIALCINLMVHLGDWLIFGVFALTFLVINFIILAIMILFANQSNLTKSLKGGNN